MQITEFIRKAYEHRIEISHKKFWIGVFLMIISWQFIAIGVSTYALLTTSWLARLTDFLIQLTSSVIVLFLASIIQGLSEGRFLKGYQILKITRQNTVIKDGQVRQLSYRERIGFIYARAALATIGYLLLEWAKVFIGVIDNSTLHGADALIYALMFGWWLEKRTAGHPAYTKVQWIGMLVSASAVLCAFIYESSGKSLTFAFGGVAIGLGSAIMLAILLLISGIIVYHDSVIRIAFHSCLFGVITSLILIAFIIILSYGGNFLEIFYVIKQLNLKASCLVGALYGIALLGFLQSYKYIETTLIAMLGNSLGIGAILIAFFITHGEVNYKDIGISTLLTIGSIILGIDEWKKLKKF